MGSKFIFSLKTWLKSGKALSFVNSVAILLFVICFFAFNRKSETYLDKSSYDGVVLTDTISRNDITFIQPFTSLAGFNWRFGKENKRKEREVTSLVLPLINFWK